MCNGQWRSDFIPSLTYIWANNAYTAQAAENLTLYEVNAVIHFDGDITPFVARYNGGPANLGTSYEILLVGDVVSVTGGTTLNNVQFTVGGENPTVCLEAGETIVAGVYQTGRQVYIEFAGGCTANGPGDWIRTDNRIPTNTCGNFEDAQFFFNGTNYRYNIGFETASTASCGGSCGEPGAGGGGSECGNGDVESGEDCDPGAAVTGDCCDDSCLYEVAATECRASTSSCDPAEVCSGSGDACPTDVITTTGPDNDDDSLPDSCDTDDDNDGAGDDTDNCRLQSNTGQATWSPGSYSGGETVTHFNHSFQCIDDVFTSRWCGQAAYEPGAPDRAFQWAQAWQDLGECGNPTPPCTTETWSLGTSYGSGDRVVAGGYEYACKGAPFTAWCGIAPAYEPGEGLYFAMAWRQVQQCD